METQDQEAWTIEDLSHPSVLTKRIDLARLGLYRLIGRTASDTNFYFESVLNLFIAAVQLPLSFAVLKKQKGELRPVFHMCTDKNHQVWFEGLLRSKVFESRDNCFPLFPVLLDNEYFISIWLMHTKIPLRGERTTLIQFPDAMDRKSLLSQPQTVSFPYVADCGEYFFTNAWDGFKTDFSPFVGPSIRLSLEKLERNHAWVASRADCRAKGAKWPPDCIQQLGAQKIIKHPNPDKEIWHDHVAKTLEPTLSAMEFGMQAISSLLRQHGTAPLTDKNDFLKSDSEKVSLKKNSNVPTGNGIDDTRLDNITIMYRAFDRDDVADDHGRHATVDGAYPYNVRILLPTSSDGSESKLELFFQKLKIDARRLGYPQAAGGFSWTYSSTADSSPSRSDRWIQLRYALVRFLDDWFWSTLVDDGGIKELLSILASPVGNNSRSISDPVFNTGLIHYNPIFELGGLDRVQIEKLPKKFVESLLESPYCSPEGTASGEEKTQLLEGLNECGSVGRDVKRIATFFYVASAMVRGGLSNSNFVSSDYTAKNLGAILLPIKIRGSVWAVSVHATIIEPEGPRHLPTWMANFFLMTNQLENLNFVIDRALWDNLERRVTKLLASVIGSSALPRAGGVENFESSLDTVNTRLSRESRLVPFVLPKFELIWDSYENSRRNSVSLLPAEERQKGFDMDVRWELEPNPFFIARQEWHGKTSRNLAPAIDLGLNLGLRDLALLREEIDGQPKDTTLQ